ncbi:MAG TPA: HAD family hydrolase [Acidimicrobiales bacterium]
MAVPLEAVTFDFWNTLIQEGGGAGSTAFRERRVDVWLGLFEGEGIALERASIDAAYTDAWNVFQDHWTSNRPYGAAQAVDEVLARLGLEIPAGLRDELLAVVTDPAAEHYPFPTDGIGDCLERLSSAGLRIGIICDVGLAPSPTLRRYLAHHSLLDYFDHWSFSDEVGTFKPDPAIFHHALSGLGAAAGGGPIDPGAAAHVGDLRRTDIGGARAVGMTAVRYSGVFDDPGSPEDGTDEVDGDLVIAHHADLPAALGV